MLFSFDSVLGIAAIQPVGTMNASMAAGSAENIGLIWNI